MSKDKIFSRIVEIEQKRTELSKEDIDLGLIDDLSKDESSINKEIANVSRIADNIKSLWSTINSVIDDIDSLKTQLSNSKGAGANLGGSIQDAYTSINKAKSIANELGQSPDDIKGYKKLQDTIKRGNDAMKELDKVEDMGTKLISKI